MLSRLLGPDRVTAEPDALAELAHLCGHLPLALRVAAADLTAHPGLEGDALTTLAAIHLDQDQPATALDHLDRALAIHTQTGELLGLARSHLLAEHALHRLDRLSNARRHRDAAVALLAGTGAHLPEPGHKPGRHGSHRRATALSVSSRHGA